LAPKDGQRPLTARPRNPRHGGNWSGISHWDKVANGQLNPARTPRAKAEMVRNLMGEDCQGPLYTRQRTKGPRREKWSDSLIRAECQRAHLQHGKEAKGPRPKNCPNFSPGRLATAFELKDKITTAKNFPLCQMLRK